MLKGISDTRIARAMAWSACLFLLLPLPARAQDGRIDEAALKTSIHNLVAEASYLRPRLDRAQFELKPLLGNLDYDAEELVRHVTNEIALEVYSGALRGARGTLISGAGNALDQSLLLATLLRDAGYEAVIQRSRLSVEAANRLITSMADRPAPVTIWQESPRPPSAAVDPAGLDRSQWVGAAREKANHLLEALDRSGIRLDGASVMAAVREDARDYFWVDYQDGPASAWRSAHPAFGKGMAVEVMETFAGGVPAELAHRVVIELEAVQRRGSEVLSEALFTPIELASTNLTGSPLSLTLVPDQLLNADSPLDLDAWVRDTRFLVPIVNGEMPAGAHALSLRGLLVPVDALALGAAGIFETQSEKGAQAVDAIGNLGEEEADRPSAIAIEALRLRVTFHAPDGSERVAVRALFDAQRDLRGPGGTGVDARNALVKALSRDYRFVFATGRYHEGYVLDAVLAGTESLDDLMAAAERRASQPCDSLRCLAEIDWEPPESGAAEGMLYRGFDGLFVDAAEIVAYRHLPNLFVISQSLFPDSSTDLAEQRMDIVSIARRVLSTSGGRISADPAAYLLTGVWETQIETDLLPNPEGVAPSPSASFASLQRIERSEVEQYADGNPVARGMLEDLQAGFVVFADSTLDLSQRAPERRWWRVDPMTGETLGMNQFGGAVSEFALLMVLSAVLIQIAVHVTVVDCVNQGSYTLASCYACENGISKLMRAASITIERQLSGSMDTWGGFWPEVQAAERQCHQDRR